MATELVVSKSAFLDLPEDLQEIVRMACQAEYDQVASDFHANDPQALTALVNDHGVLVKRFPEEILQAGAKAAMEIIAERRDSADPLTKKTVESFLSALALLRSKTEGSDLPYLIAREKYVKY
jgi:TRAP-type mannitol/chloroaromatic compound transport system substrate-binding protein